MFYNYPHYFFITIWWYRNGITQNRLGLYKKAKESLMELNHLMIVAKKSFQYLVQETKLRTNSYR